MPELEEICDFISSNYPYARDITEEQIINCLSKIIQKIGQQQYLYNIEDSVVCKLINESMLLHDKILEEKAPELAFLKY